MTKIDLDKFVASILNYKPEGEEKEMLQKALNNSKRHGYFPCGVIRGTLLRAALRDQGLVFENGQIKNKPKLKVGDFVKHLSFPNEVYQIKSIDLAGDYELESVDGVIGNNIAVATEEYVWPWTIQDAKDGDVLSYVTDEEDLWIMIYWSLYEPYDGHVHYHALLVNDNFADKGTCCICIDNLKPATKEQRDLLFQKMHEAGYEWDSEKHTLSLMKKDEPISPFESRLREILGEILQRGGISKEEIKETAKKLTPELMQLAYDEIKKDLPRWRHCEPSFYSYTENSVELEMKNVSHMGITTSYNRLRKGNYYIPIVELEKLPKEK